MKRGGEGVDESVNGGEVEERRGWKEGRGGEGKVEEVGREGWRGEQVEL